MKAYLLLVVALAAISQAAVVRAPVSRADLSLGYIGYGDRLLARQYLYQPAIPNTIQYQDFVYQGNRSVRVSAIQATEVGYSQYASAFLVQGGLGQSNVTVRVQSYRGYGFYYLIDIWGR